MSKQSWLNPAAWHLLWHRLPHLSSYFLFCSRLSSFPAWSSDRPSSFLVSCRGRRLWRHSWFRAPHPSCPVLHCCPERRWVRPNQEPIRMSVQPKEELLGISILFSYTGDSASCFRVGHTKAKLSPFVSSYVMKGRGLFDLRMLLGVGPILCVRQRRVSDCLCLWLRPTQRSQSSHGRLRSRHVQSTQIYKHHMSPERTHDARRPRRGPCS
jgi:hypothetical protein